MSRRQGLLLLCAFALAVRVAAIFALHDPEHPPYTYEHGEIAANLASGNGFAVRFLGADGPTSQQAPVYPAMLALAYRSLGSGSSESLLCMQLAQAVAGSLTAVLLTAVGWSLLPKRPEIGWIAGAFVAINPVQAYMAIHIQVAVWATFAMAVAAALATTNWNSNAKHALLGAWCGVLLLIEPILALAVPLFWWLAARSVQGTANRLRTGTLCVACMCVVIAPWMWRNYRLHGEPVFVKSTFGYAFWQGNNTASWGTDKIPKPTIENMLSQHDGSLAGVHRALSSARLETLYIDDVLLTANDYAQLRTISEPARSRLLMRRALDELTWSRYLQLCVQRLEYFLAFDTTNPKSASLLYRTATVVWLATCIIGFVALRRDWRQLWPFAGIFLIVMTFHVLTITSPRFRIPVETLTYLWSAAAVAAAWSAIRPKGQATTARQVELLPHDSRRKVAIGQHAKQRAESLAAR